MLKWWPQRTGGLERKVVPAAGARRRPADGPAARRGTQPQASAGAQAVALVAASRLKEAISSEVSHGWHSSTLRKGPVFNGQAGHFLEVNQVSRQKFEVA